VSTGLQTLSRDEIATTLRRHSLLDRLSEREAEVLHRLARGETHDTISRHMRICPRTVAASVAALVDLCGAVNHANAVALAYETGVLQVGDAQQGSAR
jgi:DNA-binding NarL/FixJ family response regulator